MAIPASLIFLAVPPDPSKRTPLLERAVANGSKPVLSYTERSAIKLDEKAV
jgi:hypothetical protein